VIYPKIKRTNRGWDYQWRSTKTGLLLGTNAFRHWIRYPLSTVEIRRGVHSTQAYGCWFCLHVGAMAIYFGSGLRGRGPRLEICTPARWFRWSRGFLDRKKGGAKA